MTMAMKDEYFTEHDKKEKTNSSKKIILGFFGLVLLVALAFGKWKLSRLPFSGAVLLIGGLVFALSTTSKADATKLPY